MDVFHSSHLTPAYTQQPSYDPSHKYPLSSTQKYWTYRQHTAHARVQRQCSVVTDILGIVAYEHWLGEGSCPYQSWHELT